jgi:hypothetical protein
LTIRLSFTACAFLIGLSAVALSAHAAPNSPADKCGADIGTAIATAERALDADSPTADRQALECLLVAMAALDSRVSALSNGSLPFDGQIYAPKGFIMSKPSVQEGR